MRRHQCTYVANDFNFYFILLIVVQHALCQYEHITHVPIAFLCTCRGIVNQPDASAVALSAWQSLNSARMADARTSALKHPSHICLVTLSHLYVHNAGKPVAAAQLHAPRSDRHAQSSASQSQFVFIVFCLKLVADCLKSQMVDVTWPEHLKHRILPDSRLTSLLQPLIASWRLQLPSQRCGQLFQG